MNRNYQKELEKIIEENQKTGKDSQAFFAQLLCACSSYVLEYLSRYFEITDFFYNPIFFPGRSTKSEQRS